MSVVGIVCEYNPFHLGHRMQFQRIRDQFGAETAIVCLMSGNFVQRGAPAIFDKTVRARAAVLAGADLVLELPIGACLSSAEGFASGGVKILSSICDILSFGTETMEKAELFRVASMLNSESFQSILKDTLSTGCSFPAARQKALEQMGNADALPVSPNDILATEYCRAILNQDSGMAIFPIHRPGNYHAQEINASAPSATSIRNMLETGQAWETAVPECAAPLFAASAIHTIANAEKAILYRLRTLTDDEFEALPYGSEGLWRRFMHACRSQADLETIIAETKTKRYTRTRIDRMVMCAFLDLTAKDIAEPFSYVRILAFNDKGRGILNNAKSDLKLLNVGEKIKHPHWQVECRISDLYGLFSSTEEQPGQELRRRVFYFKGNSNGTI